MTRHRNHVLTNRHAVILRPLDKLHYDQEVAREAHLVDNLKFDIRALVILRTAFFTLFFIREKEFKTFFQTFFGFHDGEVFRGHFPVGNCGRKYSPKRTVTLQRLAISTLLSSASGMSEKSSHISSSLRMYC